MGKMILCCGSRAERPYVLPATGLRIYSIEELCCYMRGHIYFIDEGMFSDTLIDWIGSELKLAGHANTLRQLKRAHADIKSMLAAVLCSCDYFTEQEIKEIVRMVEEAGKLTPLMKLRARADSYMDEKRYAQAVVEYEGILKSNHAGELSPEEYGDILHNLAVAKVHIKGLKSASDIFRQAYELNRREETLRQYIYTLWMQNRKDVLKEKLEDYQVPDHLYEEMASAMEEVSLQAASYSGTASIDRLKKLKAAGDNYEYKKQLDDILEGWIAAIRQF